jgi:hypothetical protein
MKNEQTCSFSRRRFAALALGALAAPTCMADLPGSSRRRRPTPRRIKMSEIALEPLPYAENALEPVITAKTISFHYGKHHAGYVATLNKLIAGTQYAGMSLEAIVRAAAASSATPIFNNAAQTWNHTFYWKSLAPVGAGGAPEGELLLRWKVRNILPEWGYRIYFIYFILCLPSLAQAADLLISWYAVWKMMTLYLFYLAVY